MGQKEFLKWAVAQIEIGKQYQKCTVKSIPTSLVCFSTFAKKLAHKRLDLHHDRIYKKKKQLGRSFQNHIIACITYILYQEK